MKILKLNALDKKYSDALINFDIKCMVDPRKVAKLGKASNEIRKRLLRRGFDLTKPYGIYKGINSFNYLFTQE